MKCPSENFECYRFTTWLTSKKLRHTHVPNETVSKSQAIKNKRLGTSPGVPDYLILTPTGIIFVEMKRRTGGRLSAYQKEWLAALTQCNVPAKVCAGFDEAKQFVEEFL